LNKYKDEIIKMFPIIMGGAAIIIVAAIKVEYSGLKRISKPCLDNHITTK
jgi:hypothetical protein